LAFPGLVKGLDDVVVEAIFIGQLHQRADNLASLTTLGTAQPRWRPALGQPDSPIRIGLPGIKPRGFSGNFF